MIMQGAYLTRIPNPPTDEIGADIFPQSIDVREPCKVSVNIVLFP